MQVVERWIVTAKARLRRDARLRKRRVVSLAAVNAAIATLLAALNDKVTRHLGASRRALFAQLDKPALTPLPATPYEYAEWLERRAGLDCHVDVAKHHYSVPHQLLKKALWVRDTAHTVEVVHEGQRIASHVRISGNRRHTTVAEHMPASHRRHAGITPDEIRRRAARAGPNTARLVDLILRTKTHPEQGVRARQCRSELPWSRHRSERRWRRFEARGGRAVLQLGAVDPEEQPGNRRRPPTPAAGPAITHPNIRRTKGAPLTRGGAPPARRWPEGARLRRDAPMTSTEKGPDMLDHPTHQRLRALKLVAP